mmetsp:Transcript_13720/g.20761  ORF Transcript_13720/g.20761 Transcript_13720/m.20761 type:complete len:129 (+) Transcript_13720:345-731(+)
MEACADLSNDKVTISLVANQKNAILGNFSRKFALYAYESERRYLPIRANGGHICYPNVVFRNVIAPVVKIMIGRRHRLMLQFHHGLQKDVLSRLQDFGISKEIVPYDLGGDLKLDVVAWLEKRRALDL